IVLPDCACTSCTNAVSVEQVSGRSLRTRNVCACSTLSARLVPGPTPVTALPRSASCSSAPFTCTLKLAVAELPCVSVAVQVTVVVPIGNALPEAGLQISEETASSGSVADTEY